MTKLQWKDKKEMKKKILTKPKNEQFFLDKTFDLKSAKYMYKTWTGKSSFAILRILFTTKCLNVGLKRISRSCINEDKWRNHDVFKHL